MVVNVHADAETQYGEVIKLRIYEGTRNLPHKEDVIVTPIKNCTVLYALTSKDLQCEDEVGVTVEGSETTFGRVGKTSRGAGFYARVEPLVLGADWLCRSEAKMS